MRSEEGEGLQRIELPVSGIEHTLAEAQPGSMNAKALPRTQAQRQLMSFIFGRPTSEIPLPS